MIRLPPLAALKPKRPIPGKTPWYLLVVLLGTFLAQLALQGASRPDEALCLTLERLTGIDITYSMTMTKESHQPMMGMGHQSLGKSTSVSSMPGHHHHQGDMSCPLCLLLAHIFFTPVLALITLGASLFAKMRWERPTQPRASPARQRWQSPPSHAPPLYT